MVTTYNRSGHLARCLASLEMQTRVPDEVVIADDGSDGKHAEAIEEIMMKSRLSLVHARQEHRGYRLCASRNNAARHASGDYLFFTDGDAVLFPEAVEEHVKASGPRLWVTGRGIWLSEDETARVPEELIRQGKLGQFWSEMDEARRDQPRRSAIRFRKNALRARLWPAERRMRKVKLCTIQASMWRRAFEAVNGYDEHFADWGYEDLDMGLRLQLAGYKGRTVADTSRLLHLYHEPLPRPVQDDPKSSYSRCYYSRPRKRAFWCENGFVKCARHRRRHMSDHAEMTRKGSKGDFLSSGSAGV
jgi:glycosyltransferase involved in cell wall biosynthesis